MARFALLVVTSIVGMSMLGVVAFLSVGVAYSHRLPEMHELGVFLAPAAVGGIVGFLSMPFVVIFLKDADLSRALPRVYGFSLIPAILWPILVPAGFGITAAVPVFFTVVLLSGWCGVRLALPRDRSRCEKCDDDLTGCIEPGCPECGWGRAANRQDE